MGKGIDAGKSGNFATNTKRNKSSVPRSVTSRQKFRAVSKTIEQIELKKKSIYKIIINDASIITERAWKNSQIFVCNRLIKI